MLAAPDESELSKLRNRRTDRAKIPVLIAARGADDLRRRDATCNLCEVRQPGDGDPYHGAYEASRLDERATSSMRRSTSLRLTRSAFIICFVTAPPRTSESLGRHLAFRREAKATAAFAREAHAAAAASSPPRDDCRARLRAIAGAPLPYRAIMRLAAGLIFADGAMLCLRPTRRKRSPAQPDPALAAKQCNR